jgi:gluconolactonase
MGLVWVYDAMGVPVAVVRSPRGLGTTNCAFGDGAQSRTLYITESDTGAILRATFPEDLNIRGAPMFSGVGAS